MTNGDITAITHCRICESSDLQRILDLGSQALTGVFPRTREQVVPLAPLELVKCSGDGSCGLVQLRHSFSPPALYGANYGYRSGLNRAMVEHLRTKIAALLTHAPVGPGDTVLDIGSNDGTTLSFYPGDAKRIGIDPTAAKFASHYKPGITVVPEFFSAEAFLRASGGARARIVTSIAMLYDLESPLMFAREVREVLAEGGLWHFEQSYLPLMMSAGAYDTICHEHLEYYSYAQIRWMLEKLGGFRVVDVTQNDANGGSFAVTVQRTAAGFDDGPAGRALMASERALRLHEMDPYRRFVEGMHRHRDELRAMLSQIKNEGGVVLGMGASTKGNVLLQFCGLGTDFLSAIAEVNPDKYGSFTPGTLVPIVSEADAQAMNPSVYLVLPWHFRAELVRRSKDLFANGSKLLFPLPRLEMVSS